MISIVPDVKLNKIIEVITYTYWFFNIRNAQLYFMTKNYYLNFVQLYTLMIHNEYNKEIPSKNSTYKPKYKKKIEPKALQNLK